MNSEKKSRIKKLKEKIASLKEVYSEDVKASHHEPGQTLEMIQLMERQLLELQSSEDSAQDKEIVQKKFVLEDSSGNTREFIVTSGTPDPSMGMISVDSPVGSELMRKKKGQSIMIGNTEYKIR